MDPNLNSEDTDVLFSQGSLILQVNRRVLALLTQAFQKCAISETGDSVAYGLLNNYCFQRMELEQLNQLLLLACSTGSVRGLAALLDLPAASSMTTAQRFQAVSYLAYKIALELVHINGITALYEHVVEDQR